MILRHDPYQAFRSSKTPAGIYARPKWLGEAESPQWKIDFQMEYLLSNSRIEEYRTPIKLRLNIERPTSKSQ